MSPLAVLPLRPPEPLSAGADCPQPPLPGAARPQLPPDLRHRGRPGDHHRGHRHQGQVRGESRVFRGRVSNIKRMECASEKLNKVHYSTICRSF